MASEQIMPVIEVNRLYEVISAKLAAIQQLGYAVCIRAPKNTFVFCFEVQKRIVCFPFSCAKTIFDKIRDVLVRRGNRQRPPNIAELLTGIKNPTERDVLTATRDLRNAYGQAISNKTRLGQYQKVLEKWCSENCKNIESFTFNTEDKDIVKSLAVSLKQVKALKYRKYRLNEAFNDTLANMIEREYVTQNELKHLKNNFKNIAAVSSELKEKRNTFLSMVDSSNKLGHFFTKIVLNNDVFCDNVSLGCEPDISFGLSQKVKTVLSKAKRENISIKTNVSENSEKIEAILKMTENISVIVQQIKEQLVDQKFMNEISNLQGELEKEKQILVSVVEDRDSMKEKLDILLTFIEEQEHFLNDREREKEFGNCSERERLQILNNTDHCLYYGKYW